MNKARGKPQASRGGDLRRGGKGAPVRPKASAPVRAAEPGAAVSAGQQQAAVQAPPVMPPSATAAEMALQFGLGMVTNTAQHMRMSNVPPDVMVQALLMGAGLVMQFYRMEGVDPAAAIQAGREHQQRFEATTTPAAGSA